MACAATGCGSGCGKEDDEKLNQKGKDEFLGCSGGGSFRDDSSITDGDHLRRLCFKCKIEEPLSLTPGLEGTSGNLCVGCFRSSLFGKFKQAVTSHDMISPTDNVLVAFSGGPSSRVVLQFVHELQQKAQRNLDASRDKSYPVFGVGVATVDETDVSAVPSCEMEKAFEDLRSTVSSLSPPEKLLHIVSVGSIFSSDPNDSSNRLKELLHAVHDETGKEDLLHYLRMLVLQKIASDNGYNKLIFGSCTSRIACHILSATVKGRGYSLPADIQYVDARWQIPVVLPLRDCVAQELNMLCHLDGLKTLRVLEGPHSGINGLVSSFLAVLQEENPARERTIVRTADKLSPFHFNKLPETNGSNDHLPSRWRRRKQNQRSIESISSEFLCPICCSPLNKSDLEIVSNKLGQCETSSEVFVSSCCPNCQFQILPKEQSSVEQFYSLLPQPVTSRVKDCINRDQAWLREQIKDCLLSDGEDET